MSVSEQPPLARGETLRFDQRAKLSSFLGLSLKNGLLNIVTLTLYRFWGKTEVRRRVWSSTYLNDEPFEYTGKGKELFFGFLFALLVVGLPFLLVVFAIQFLGPAVATLLIFPLEIGLFFLIGFGMFTAFRYMASRTLWRGIRFQLDGSASDYGLRFLAYLFVSGLTLGWFWPTARRKLAKHLWGKLKIGDRKFRFDVEASNKEGVYGAYALAWVGTAVTYLLFIGAVFGMVYAFKAELEGGGEPPASMILTIYAMATVLALVLAVIFAPFQAAILRSVAAGIVLDEARFKLRIGWTDMVWMTLSNVFLVTITLGFLMPFVQARTSVFLIERLSSEGVADLASIRQAERGPKTGEGLADAFGIAPI